MPESAIIQDDQSTALLQNQNSSTTKEETQTISINLATAQFRPVWAIKEWKDRSMGRLAGGEKERPMPTQPAQHSKCQWQLSKLANWLLIELKARQL